MVDKREDALKEIMVSNLERTINFIQFAEAKNGAVLTFSAAWSLACISIVISDMISNIWLQTALEISAPISMLAALIAVVSFDPKLIRRNEKNESLTEINLLYFGDIAKVGIEDFRTQSIARYCLSDPECSEKEYINDLMDQVFINSKIALRKFQLFKLSCFFVAGSLFITIILPAIGVVFAIWSAIQ